MTASDVVRDYERRIDNSGLVAKFEACFEAANKRPGRPAEFNVRAFLVGIGLLAETGTLHLIRLAPLLNELDTASRHRLGLTRPEGVTRRQVEGMFKRVADVLSAGQGLNEMCDMLMSAFQIDDEHSPRSIAIDSTTHDTWARPPAKKNHKNRPAGGVSKDPDAKWRKKDANNPWRKPCFGYDVTVAVTVPEVSGPGVVVAGVPVSVTALRIRPACEDVVATGVEVVKQTAVLRVGLKDVLADRGYTATANGSGFIMPVRALGGEPVFELYENQRGAHGTAHGAIIIDGQPFSPSCPPTLFDIPKPPVSASTADIVAYQNAIAVRAQYALVPYGSRKKNGAQNFRCPARCKKLSCPLVATSKKSAFPVFTNPKIAAPNSVCSQQYKLFAAADIPLSQREMFGSKAWYDSNNRRSRVEGFFGNIKNEACENLRHGTIRVMGLAKTGFMIAFAVAATNLRLIRSFLASGKAAVRAKKGRGRPRKPGVQVFLPAGVTLAAPNAPPGR